MGALQPEGGSLLRGNQHSDLAMIRMITPVIQLSALAMLEAWKNVFDAGERWINVSA